MDRQAIDDLQAEYPNRQMICIPPHQPTECVIEVLKGQKLGVAVALIDRSQSHRHRLTTEIYEVLEGELTLHLDGKSYRLRVGETATIPAGVSHWAEGDSTKVLVFSTPAWTSTDHDLDDD